MCHAFATSERLSIEVFWSFRSPWSYLATARLAERQRRYQLDVVFRPVYPIAALQGGHRAQVFNPWRYGYDPVNVALAE